MPAFRFTMPELVQDTTDKEPCKMRNAGGSECGKCECQSPVECKHRGSEIASPLHEQFRRFINYQIDKLNEEVN